MVPPILRFVDDQFYPAIYLALQKDATAAAIIQRMDLDNKSDYTTNEKQRAEIQRLVDAAKNPTEYWNETLVRYSHVIDIYALALCFINFLVRNQPLQEYWEAQFSDQMLAFQSLLTECIDPIAANVPRHDVILAKIQNLLAFPMPPFDESV
jgi:hypothetical protein